ncbi:Cystinosin [Glycine max]|nr:Cystinosin [Glycine max]
MTFHTILVVFSYFTISYFCFIREETPSLFASVLLDFSGGVFNYSQMPVQSKDQGSWVNFYGNIGKVLYPWYVSILYDSIIMGQHYVIYPDNKKGLTSMYYYVVLSDFYPILVV